MQGKAGQGKAGQGRPEQGKAGQGHWNPDSQTSPGFRPSLNAPGSLMCKKSLGLRPSLGDLKTRIRKKFEPWFEKNRSAFGRASTPPGSLMCRNRSAFGRASVLLECRFAKMAGPSAESRCAEGFDSQRNRLDLPNIARPSADSWCAWSPDSPGSSQFRPITSL